MSAAHPRGDGLPRARRALRALWGGWWALLALVVADRILLLAHFSWRYTDKDQTVLWTGAYEMMHGRFHEPRWYGQAYNTLLESLLAAPLAALEVPYALALPLASSALCLAPFVLLSGCALRAGWTASAFAVLATPLLLPIRYGMLGSIPRGFVTGMVFAAIPACLMMFRLSRARGFACGFALVFALSVNPSAAILALPVGVRLLLEHGRSRYLLPWLGAGALAAGGLHLLSVAFYRLNPAHVVYGSGLPPVLAFDLALFRDNLLHAGRYLGDVSPALPGGVLLAVLLFALTLLGLARRGAARFALALAAGGALTLLSLGLERLAGGSESVLWPWSRNYLSVPLLLGLGLVWLEEASPALRQGHRLAVVGLVGLASLALFAVRLATVDEQVERQIRVKNPVGVKAWPVDEVRRRCADLVARAARHDAELVVFRGKHKILCYACEPLHDGAVRTLLIRPRVAERRTWRLLEEARRPARRALLYNFRPDEIARGRALGLETDPPEMQERIRIDPVRLPPGREAFELFAAMDVPGAADLVRRLDLLGVR